MSAVVEYASNKASEAEIAAHLLRCDDYFVPPLSSRVAIADYAKKIATKATRFEAWAAGTLVGLVASYCNDPQKRIAYITTVSVLLEWTGKDIAFNLVRQCVDYANECGMQRVSLEVAVQNTAAIKLYERSGFAADNSNVPFVYMHLDLARGEPHEKQA